MLTPRPPPEAAIGNPVDRMSKVFVVGHTIVAVDREHWEDDEEYFDRAWLVASAVARGASVDRAVADALVESHVSRGFSYRHDDVVVSSSPVPPP